MDGRPKQFILILIAFLMVLGSVMTASATVTITELTPGTGTVYSTATISGTCSATAGTVTITFGTETVGTAAVTGTGTGSFTCVFTVPIHVYGTETITATYDGAEGSATTTFFILPNVVNITTPTNNVVGTIITISGTGYAANDNITVAFGTNNNIKTDVI
ncbi:hypothetical protein CO110_02170, partial [Candidatus Desantisbacteria bacterium CG_4_9_14_3_um_filter_40_11]